MMHMYSCRIPPPQVAGRAPALTRSTVWTKGVDIRDLFIVMDPCRAIPNAVEPEPAVDTRIGKDYVGECIPLLVIIAKEGQRNCVEEFITTP